MSTAIVDNLRIRRRSLHDVVVDRLRDMIVEGVLGPGQRLNERLLCEQLGGVAHASCARASRCWRPRA